MARLYANENFPRQVVEELRRLGYDVLTVLETGNAGISWPDHEVLAFAVSEDRIVLTLNRKHFRALHVNDPNHCGIVTCTVGQAGRIDQAIRDASDCRGRLINVYRPKT
jgi:hypothetical protein